MGRGRLSGSHGLSAAQQPQAAASTVAAVQAAAAPQQPAPKPAAPQGSQPPTGAHGFPELTAAQQTAIVASQRTRRDWSTYQANQDYINPAQTHTGYGFAQNVNYELENGTAISKLSPRAQRMVAGLDKLMGPIGHETTLYRGDHDDFIARHFGIKNPGQMSDAQLHKALVGKSWTAKGFTSTSHDRAKSPFLPGGMLGGGREVQLTIHTSKTLKAAMVQKSQAEVALGRGTQFKITGVRHTGGTAYPRAGGAKKVIEIIVEAW